MAQFVGQGPVQVSLGDDVKVVGEFQFHLLETIDLSPVGYAININWSNASGANSIEVTGGKLTIAAPGKTASLGSLTLSAQGNHQEISLDKGHQLQKLQLNGLEFDIGGIGDFIPFSNSSVNETQRGAGPRLVLAVPDDRLVWNPLYAMPAISPSGTNPRTYSGAFLHNSGAVDLPADMPPVEKLRLSVVDEIDPDMTVYPSRLTSVTAWALLLPQDMELTTPAGEILWEYPGEYPAFAAPVEIDLQVPLQAWLEAQLAQQASLAGAFKLSGKAGSQAGILVNSLKGALLRTFDAPLTHELAGEPVTMDLPGEPLAAEQPGSVSAAISLRYAGIRILETVNDPLPAAQGNISGRIVGETPVVRQLPPLALVDYALARVGLVGRAPEACELVVQPVDMSGGNPGQPLGDPGVVQLEPAGDIGLVWVEIPSLPAQPGPVGISLRANLGRFFWVAAPDPQLKLAVYDPDPGGRPLRLNNQTILPVNESEPPLATYHLPPSLFQSQPPLLDSPLFLTVDFSDLVLRYPR